MSSKININYDKLVDRAEADKNKNELIAAQDVRIKEVASRQADKMLAARANLRAGEHNYYGSMLWSRVDAFADAIERAKEISNQILEGAVQPLSLARQKGALHEFIAGVSKEVDNAAALKDISDPAVISRVTRSSWTRLGGFPQQDFFQDPSSRNRKPTAENFGSAGFWRDTRDLYQISRLENAFHLERNEKIRDLLGELEAGVLSEQQFVQSAKAAYDEGLDKAFSFFRNKVNDHAELIDQVHTEWKTAQGQIQENGQERTSFRGFFEQKIASLDSSGQLESSPPEMMEAIGVVTLLVQGPYRKDSQHHVDARVDLIPEDRLVGQLIKEIKEPRGWFPRILDHSTVNAARSTVNSAYQQEDSLAATTIPEPTSPEPTPWYRRVFGKR